LSSSVSPCPSSARAPRRLVPLPTRRSSDLGRRGAGPQRERRPRRAGHGGGDQRHPWFTPADQIVCPSDFSSAHLPAVGSRHRDLDRKSTRLNSSHVKNSYAVFGLEKQNE